MKKFSWLKLFLLVFLFLMAGDIQAKTTSSKQNQIKKFNSLNEFRRFINKQANLNQGGITLYGSLDDSVRSAAPTSALAGDKELSVDYSPTNIQVAGVDESDVVKTDGQFIYSINQKEVVISDVRQAEEARVVTRISFKNQPQNLYLNNNKLIVIGQDYQFTQIQAKLIMPRGGFVFVKVFDVTDKAKPKEVRSLRLEGDYNNSRVIEGQLYLITNNYNYAIGSELLPRIYENDKLINAEKNTARYRLPKIYYFDMPYSNLNLTTVAAIALRDDAQPIKTEIYALPGNEIVYASQKALYIAYTKYFDQTALRLSVSKEVVGPKLAAEDRDKIKKIEAVDYFILDDFEKLVKVNWLMEKYLMSLSMTDREQLTKKIEELTRKKILANLNDLQVTVIHKINIKGQELSYQGFAEVPGRMINQFALDEQGDYLRVATTKDGASSLVYLPNLEDKRSNNVYVIDDKMKVVGRLEGLAQSEQIYAARFMGDRLYLITFEQVDPLLVIDLSKPNSPKVLGELKIPGFSQYLHPYDKQTLIGIGRETSLIDGRVVAGGLKISLFDVAQVDRPRELASLVLGEAGSDSVALYDHKAVLFSAEKNLLALPVTLTRKLVGQTWGERDFDGLAVLTVDGKGLRLRGRLSHGDLTDYKNKIKRALYIKDKLFSLSEGQLYINKLDNLEQLNKLQLLSESDYQISN